MADRKAEMTLKKPYWVMPSDEDMPFDDFNREIVTPGLLPEFPDGAVGVRVDDDFYCIAALPFKEYIGVTIQEIVKEFWPSKFEVATFGEDNVMKPDDDSASRT